MTSYRDWLKDRDTVSKWVAQYDLPALLEQGSGIVRIADFLPGFVADGMLGHMEGLPQQCWALQHSAPDYVETNISHSFSSAQACSPRPIHSCERQLQAFEEAQPVLRVFEQLGAGAFCTFSAGRYFKY